MSANRSSNFDFLKPYGPLFVQLPAFAERYLHDDPNTALIKLRQFAEMLAQDACARLGVNAQKLNQAVQGYSVPTSTAFGADPNFADLQSNLGARESALRPSRSTQEPIG